VAIRGRTHLQNCKNLSLRRGQCKNVKHTKNSAPPVLCISCCLRVALRTSAARQVLPRHAVGTGRTVYCLHPLQVVSLPCGDVGLLESALCPQLYVACRPVLTRQDKTRCLLLPVAAGDISDVLWLALVLMLKSIACGHPFVTHLA